MWRQYFGAFGFTGILDMSTDVIYYRTNKEKVRIYLLSYALSIWLTFRATSARQDATGMDITSRCTLGDPNKLPEGVPQPARMPYVSDKHPRQTLEVINLLRKHRELCDVVLVVGAKKIYAHRVILSACSPYFRYKEINLVLNLHFIKENISANESKLISKCRRSALSDISCSVQGDVHWRAGREQAD